MKGELKILGVAHGLLLGLVLAAPLASAAVHISRDLARARVAAAQAEDGGVPVADPA